MHKQKEGATGPGAEPRPEPPAPGWGGGVTSEAVKSCAFRFQTSPPTQTALSRWFSLSRPLSSPLPPCTPTLCSQWGLTHQGLLTPVPTLPSLRDHPQAGGSLSHREQLQDENPGSFGAPTSPPGAQLQGPGNCGFQERHCVA